VAEHTLWQIGSSEWFAQLADLGTTRERIDAIWAQTLDDSANIDRALEIELELPPTPRPNAAELNVHALSPAGSRAEVAAFWMLLFLEIPTYATLMNLRLDCWIDGDAALHESTSRP
jgi:hypothetical protein